MADDQVRPPKDLARSAKLGAAVLWANVSGVTFSHDVVPMLYRHLDSIAAGIQNVARDAAA